MSGYTRQQTYIDGDVILAEHTNDEFDLLEEVFSTTLGHKHDGTVAEGPTIDLLSDNDNDTTIEVERTPDVDTIHFKTLGIDRLTIDNTGLSTFTGSVNFDSSISLDNNVAFQGEDTLSAAQDLIKMSAGDVTTVGNGTYPTEVLSATAFTIDVGGTDRIFVDGSNVGIGTVTPDQQLHVVAGNPTLKLEATNNNNAPKIDLFGKNSGGVVHNAAFNYTTGSSLRIYSDQTNTNPNSTIEMNVDGTKRATFNEDSQLLMLTGSAPLPTYSFDGDTNTGMYRITGDTLGFGTNGIERIRIDASGNVGIGDSSPDGRLHVSAGAGTLYLESTDTNNAPEFHFYGKDAGGTRRLFTTLNSTGSSSFRVQCDPNNVVGSSDIRLEVDGNASLFNVTTADIRVFTSNGDPVINDVDGVMFTSGGISHFSNTNGVALFVGRGASGQAARFHHAGSEVGNIAVNPGGTTFNSTSDYRLKDNIVDLDDAWERVKMFKPRRFNFKAEPNLTIDGFLAHEVQDVVPEAVQGEKDGEEMQNMDKSMLIPVLTAALQKAMERIEELEAKVNG